MIILDTNIISELMKSQPDPSVMRWIDQQSALNLSVTTVTLAEIAYGIRALQDGKRRDFLENAFDTTIQQSFRHRILAFDEKAAHYYGNLMAKRKREGKPMSILDGQIAAITLQHGSMLATRNIRDFVHCGLELVNPFKQGNS